MRLVSGACGYSADLIVMGKDASDAFENSDKVLAAYDKLNISPGTITPELAEYGITLLGNYRGLPLYASETQYTDATGASQYFVPPDKVLVAASDCKARSPMPELCKSISEILIASLQGNSRSVGLLRGRLRLPKGEAISRPIPIPADTQSWTVLDVI